MTDAADRLHEQLLVLRCQAGDEDAFEELVAHYHHSPNPTDTIP